MARIYAIILSLGAFVVAIDQWTKHWAVEFLGREGQSYPVLSWFSFTLVHNHGAAFGIFRNLPESVRSIALMCLSTGILFALWFFIVRHFKAHERIGPIWVGLVFGGAVGNLIDRFRLGYVVDFIDWFYPSSTNECIPLFHNMSQGYCHWPVFNMADSAIVLAMGILIVLSFTEPQKTKKTKTVT